MVRFPVLVWFRVEARDDGALVEIYHNPILAPQALRLGNIVSAPFTDGSHGPDKSHRKPVRYDLLSRKSSSERSVHPVATSVSVSV